jgi:signal peptidase complex subunit 1
MAATGGMDYVGQLYAERAVTVILTAFAAVSFVVGYAMSDFSLMVKINGAGLALALAVALPPWPFFRRNPLPWLQPLEVAESEKPKKDWLSSLLSW